MAFENKQVMKTIITAITLISIFSLFHTNGQDYWLDFQYDQQENNFRSEILDSSNQSITPNADKSSNVIENAPVDATGHTYGTVVIGNQVWLNEDLNTTYYNNGDRITNGTNAGNISEEEDPAYWFDYNNNKEKGFGKLYTWFTAMDPRGICPEG